MTQFNLKKPNPIDVINRLISLIQSSDDIIEIFQEAHRGIKRLIRCDQITMLLHHEKARYFYVNPALNANHRGKNNEDAIIAYGETSFTEILAAQRSSIRADLTGKGKLTPGDIKFLDKKMKSDLSIPIMNRNGVLGIMNLASQQTSYFTKSHQKVAEQIATLLGIVIERAQLNENLTQKIAELESWERKFTSLFETAREAMAIVRSDYDLIYETNPAFQTLTGYSAEQLQGMRLSFLHPTYRSESISHASSLSSNGKSEKCFDLPLIKNDGEQIIVRLQFAAQHEFNNDLVFAIYHPVESTVESGGELAISPDALARLNKTTCHHDLSTCFENFLQAFFSSGFFQFAVFKCCSTESKKPDAIIVSKFPGTIISEHKEAWRLLLDQEFFVESARSGQPHSIWNFSSESENALLQSLAKKLDFQSFIVLPIQIDRETQGLISFFFHQERKFPDRELAYFQSAATLFSLHLASFFLNQLQSDHRRHISVLKELQELANSASNRTEVIKNSLVTISKFIALDFAEVSLLDETGEHVQNFRIVSEKYCHARPGERWQTIEGSDCYWCDVEHKNLRQKFEHRENEWTANAPPLRSSVPVALMRQDQCLGILVIGSLESNEYDHAQELLIEQAAHLMSLAIQHFRSHAEKTDESKSVFDYVGELAHIGASLELEAVLSTIVEKSMTIMKAQLATIRLIANHTPLAELRMTETACDKGAISDFEIDYILPKIFLKNLPFLHETGAPDELRKYRDADLAEFKTFFAIPIKFDNQTIAILTIYWTSQREIAIADLDFMSAIVAQAALAIENARRHQALKDSLIHAKTKYTEIAGFIPHLAEVVTGPILSIQGMLASMQNDSLAKSSEIERDHFASIRTNLEKIQRCLNDFQGYFQIFESPNSCELVNISDVISQACSERADRLNEKHITLVVADAMPTITCHRERIAQLFAALIDHALTGFTEPAKNSIIEIGHRNVNGDHQFFVRDNGEGWSQERQDRLFDLFPNGSASEGLANSRLPLAKRIVECYQGEIWVDSAPGKGSTIYFRLPALDETTCN